MRGSSGGTRGINRPIAGPTHDVELPVGKHPLQLYSRGTPNGVKVTVMLKELLALGGTEYDAWLIDIHKGEQFGSGFGGVNPNSKIPALMDRSGARPRRVFDYLEHSRLLGDPAPPAQILALQAGCPD